VYWLSCSGGLPLLLEALEGGPRQDLDDDQAAICGIRQREDRHPLDAAENSSMRIPEAAISGSMLDRIDAEIGMCCQAINDQRDGVNQAT
jgi:hypothetical protein